MWIRSIVHAAGDTQIPPGRHASRWQKKAINPSRQQMPSIRLIDDATDVDVEAQDFHTSLPRGIPERGWREGRASRLEEDFNRLLTLADRDAGNAVQASAQRHLHGCCACGSGDATDVSQHSGYATLRLHGLP